MMARVGASGLEAMMATTPLFAGAAPEVISALDERGNVRSYRRGTYLFHQGDDAPDVVVTPTVA